MTPRRSLPPPAGRGKRLWGEPALTGYAQVHGLVRISRQYGPGLCLILFGDRIGEADLASPAATGPALLLQLRGYGARAGITIVA